MTQTITHAFLVTALAITLAGCSSTPKMPSTFLNPMNRLTADEGQRLVNDGERIVRDAEADIARGKQLVKDAQMRRDEGDALSARGRQALRAAVMAEEAEALSLKARNLKGEALN